MGESRSEVVPYQSTLIQPLCLICDVVSFALQGLIYRFEFLMVVSVLCAGMTVVFFIISNVNEVEWKFADEESRVEISSTYLRESWRSFTFSSNFLHSYFLYYGFDQQRLISVVRFSPAGYGSNTPDITQAKNMPYQPLLIKPVFSVLAHAEKQGFFKTSISVYFRCCRYVVFNLKN